MTKIILNVLIHIKLHAKTKIGIIIQKLYKMPKPDSNVFYQNLRDPIKIDQ